MSLCPSFNPYNQYQSNNEMLNKQLKMLEPLKRPTQQIYEEIEHLKRRIGLLEKELKANIHGR